MQYNDYITSRHSHSLPTLLGAEGRQDFCLMCHSTDYVLAEEGDEPTLETAVHDIECALCHDSHGTQMENNLRLNKWDTCVQCHRNGDRGVGEDPLPSMKEMVEGTIPVDGLDGEQWMGGDVICTDCHMPAMGVRVVPYDIPSHTWHFVSPAESINLGMPNSCTVTCHGDGSPEGALTDAEALAYIEDANASYREWWLRASGNMTIAGDRLWDAFQFGFPKSLVDGYNETYEELEFVLAFVERDMSRVHNPEFRNDLLEHVYMEATSIHLNLTPGKVRGTLLDEDGKGLVAAEIRENGTVWYLTGPGGFFDIEIAPGDHTFEVWVDGKRRKAFDAEDVKAGQVTEVGKVKLKSKGDDGPGFGAAAIILALSIVYALGAWTKKGHTRP
jgi:predicted CXXCH cytochrome family protein